MTINRVFREMDFTPSVEPPLPQSRGKMGDLFCKIWGGGAGTNTNGAVGWRRRWRSAVTPLHACRNATPCHIMIEAVSFIAGERFRSVCVFSYVEAESGKYSKSKKVYFSQLF